MKSFIIKIFFNLFFIFFIFFIFFYILNINYKKLECDIVFMGDSKISKGYKNSCNLGMGSESTFFTYFKIKHLLSNNKLNTIYLEFDEHSICGYYDQYNFDSKIIERYFEYLPLNKTYPYIFKLNYVKMATERIDHILKFGNAIMGGFERTKKSEFDLKTCKKRINLQFKSGLSNLNIEYFFKIKKICSENNIKLIIIKSPVHPFYLKNIPFQHKLLFNKITKNLAIINLENYLISNKNFLPDGDHLSYDGQELFTLKLDQIIQNLNSIRLNQ